VTGVLSGLRVVEVSAFIAAPLGGVTLAQMGADIIQISDVRGRIDYHRWPLADSGTSLYWTSLNKAKRSVRLDLSRPEGQELAQRLVVGSGGAQDGILLSNLPARGWMSYDALTAQRPDLIMLTLTGNPDGSTAVDYTVNCSGGFPMITGRGGEPVNHALPAWDVAAGLYLSVGLLGAERHRRLTGQGQQVSLSLADVMLSTVANLGYVAEAQVKDSSRPPLGNDVYGAFGRDFPTADGRRVMVVAISDRQWRALCEATGLGQQLAMAGPMMGVDLGDETGRYLARDAIAAVLAPWFAARGLDQVRAAFDGSGVLWGVFQDFKQLVSEDPRCSADNPMFQRIHQPGVGDILVSHTPLGFSEVPRSQIKPAPVLGEHTDLVLSEVLGMPDQEIGRLHDRGIIAGPMAA